MPSPMGFEQFLNNRLTTDIRPMKERNSFSSRFGRKRTHMHAARVLTIVGAAMLLKKLLLEGMDNAGNTLMAKAIKQGPMLRAAIKQGGLSDCYLLATILGIILVNPNYFDRIIIPIILPDGTPGVHLYFYESRTNSIVQITMSLLVSTSFNNPNDDDVRPEILEKGYPFFRSGQKDYLKANMGSGTEFGMAVFLQPIAATQTRDDRPSFIASHRAAGRVITCLTSNIANSLTRQHCLTGLDAGTLIDPWYGDTDKPVPASVLNDPKEIIVMYAMGFPTTFPLLPAEDPTPTPLPAPTPPPTPPAPPVVPPVVPPVTPPAPPSVNPDPPKENPIMNISFKNPAIGALTSSITKTFDLLESNDVPGLSDAILESYSSDADRVEVWSSKFKKGADLKPVDQWGSRLDIGSQTVTLTFVKGGQASIVLTMIFNVKAKTQPAPQDQPKPVASPIVKITTIVEHADGSKKETIVAL